MFVLGVYFASEGPALPFTWVDKLIRRQTVQISESAR
jgi:hypothetical protein